MIRVIARLMLFGLFSFNVYSGTIVDIRDQSGGNSQFLSDGKMGRLNTADSNTFIIVDYDKQSIKIVMAARRQVLDMSGELPSLGLAGPGEDKPVMKVEGEGEGPVIAGYQTEQYKLLVNGEFCGTMFTSKQAMEETGLDQMFKILQKVADQSAKSVGAAQSGISPCQLGKTNTFDHVAAIGAPLRSLDEKGNMDVEVTKIQNDVDLSPETFAIPSEYTVISAAEQMKQAESQLRAGIQKMQENMPEMEKKLAEMQKNGKVSPEAVENLRRLIEHYKTKQ